MLQKILLTGASAVPVRIDGDSGVFIRGPQEIINLDHSRFVHGGPVFHEVAARVGERVEHHERVVNLENVMTANRRDAAMEHLASWFRPQ